MAKSPTQEYPFVKMITENLEAVLPFVIVPGIQKFV
jgi:hypothetical protein